MFRKVAIVGAVAAIALAAVFGGEIHNGLKQMAYPICPQCGGTNVRGATTTFSGRTDYSFLCHNKDCGYQWPANEDSFGIAF